MVRITLKVETARFVLAFLPAFILVLLAPVGSRCQVIDPVSAAQEPISGAGHHYIGVGAETVNPADGSVSFDLPIRTPTGRQLTLPFGISFNSADPFFLLGSDINAYFSWLTPTLNGWPPPFELNGWSYKLPTYEAQAYVAYSVASPTKSDPGSNYFVYDFCWSTQNYTFSGFDGSRHVLDVSNNWPDPNNPDLNFCNQGNQGSYSGFPLYGVSANLAAGGTSTQPALTVTDRNGTVFQFAQGPGISTNPTVVAGGVTPFGSLAGTITDKNGNRIALNGASTYTYGKLLGPGSYTDTLGRNLLAWTGLGSTAGDQITVSGISTNITVKWTTTTVHLPENSRFVYASYGSICGFSGSNSLPMSVVSEIDLPNGQKYTFSYGGTWGLLDKITFPDGGYVRYVWGTNPASKSTYHTWSLSGPGASGAANCSALIDTPAITDRYVSHDGSTEVLHQQFTNYSTKWNLTTSSVYYDLPYWTTKSTTVKSSDLITGQTTEALYTYTPAESAVGPGVYSWQSNQIPVEQSVVYQDGSGTLQTVNKTWLDPYGMIGEQTVLSNGQGMTTLHCLDSFDRVLASYEYNFQSAGAKPADPTCPTAPAGSTTLSAGLNTSEIGPLLRQTTTKYHDFGTTAFILDEPDSVTVADGSGNRVSQTSYLYDGSGVMPSGAKTGLVVPPGARGNPTSVSKWLNTNNSSLTTTYSYYDTGQVQSMTDPCGNASCPDVAGSRHTTTFSYTDSFASGTGSPSGQTNAYLTQVTYPNTGAAHSESYTWGFADGLIRSHKDQNNQPTAYQYNDSLLRLTEVQGPADPSNGNQSPTTTYTYSDWTSANPTSSSIAKSVLENTSGTKITSTSVLDGLGHTVRILDTSDPSGQDEVDTVYGGLSWVYTLSNPYRSTSDSTYGVTTNTYDGLGRKTSQIDSDGTSTQRWNYSGNIVTYTDENGNQWQRTTDALGRLIKVLEPNGTAQSATQETDYSYDLLNDLIAVRQCGGPCPSSGAISRQFTYDSLARLLQAFNPEAGWTCYGSTAGAVPNGANCQSGYDANGNLTYKTDARRVVTAFGYDALNRLLSKSYPSDASNTPSSCYQYDASASNGIGRLAAEWTQSASKGACSGAPPTSGIWSRRSILAYDPLGHIQNEQQCTPSNCSTSAPYAPSYSYDLAGNLHTLSNGITTTPVVSTLSLTNAFDAAGRLQSMTSNWSDALHPATLFSAQAGPTLPCTGNQSAPYAAFGGLMNAAYGSGLSLNRSYDSRLRTTCEIDTGKTVGNSTAGSATVTVTGMEQSK